MWPCAYLPSPIQSLTDRITLRNKQHGQEVIWKHSNRHHSLFLSLSLDLFISLPTPSPLSWSGSLSPQRRISLYPSVCPSPVTRWTSLFPLALAPCPSGCLPATCLPLRTPSIAPVTGSAPALGCVTTWAKKSERMFQNWSSAARSFTQSL